MDDLLREFLAETGEHIETVDAQLVRFEREPNNGDILRNIFRLVHTIKGTCGFLQLPRLEALAHAAEALIGRFRDGEIVTTEAVTVILLSIDRIKEILATLGRTGNEPTGTDEDLIGHLEHLAAKGLPSRPSVTVGEIAYQVLERPLLPGEDSLDDLERVFRETQVEPVFAPAAIAATKPARAAPEAPAAAREEAPATEEAARNQTIRVNVSTIEHLMTMVSELVLTRNQLLEVSRRRDDADYKVPLQRLSHVTAELQDGVMKTRMQPISTAWQKLPRVVRDLAKDLGKNIDLKMQGSDTELDRQVLELIRDPLTHMVRNSADHGIETTAERRARGKPDRATIRLSASHEAGTITIEIADDGRGLDLAAIGRMAIERGLTSEAELERLSENQVARFIFHPGFSTAKTVTAVSGRGVGMDVVRANIEAIGGTVEIAAVAGQGTSFAIKIPLTLAIVAALIVGVGSERVAVPQVSVLELVRVKPGGEHRVERVNGAPVMRLRDRLLPIVPLAQALDPSTVREEDSGFVLVTQVGARQFGMMVDAVFHTEEIVVKPMSRKLRQIGLYSGNTILGDGAVVLIMDPGGIARMVGMEESETGFAGDSGAANGAGEDERERTTLLVFRAGGDGYRAVPLSLVTRLEEIDTTRVEWVGGRPLLQYRGRLMPLVPVDRTEIRREGAQPIVVFSEGGSIMGLVVESIVDVVEEAFDIEPVVGRDDLIGSAVVRGRATEIVNVAHYLPLADAGWLAGGTRRTGERRVGTVLLVEPSPFLREMLVPVLRAAGHSVLAVADTDAAMTLLGSGRRFRAILADIDPPARRGIDLAAALAGQPAHAGLPLIGLSAGIDPDLIERARAAGFTDFAAKFDRAGLLGALGALGDDSIGEAA